MEEVKIKVAPSTRDNIRDLAKADGRTMKAYLERHFADLASDYLMEGSLVDYIVGIDPQRTPMLDKLSKAKGVK